MEHEREGGSLGIYGPDQSYPTNGLWTGWVKLWSLGSYLAAAPYIALDGTAVRVSGLPLLSLVAAICLHFRGQGGESAV